MLSETDWGKIDKAAVAAGYSVRTPEKWRERGIPKSRVPWLAKATKIPMQRLDVDVYAQAPIKKRRAA